MCVTQSSLLRSHDHMAAVSMAGVAVVRQIGMDWDTNRSLACGASAREGIKAGINNIEQPGFKDKKYISQMSRIDESSLMSHLESRSL